MTEQRRIPRGIDPFDPYINRIVVLSAGRQSDHQRRRVGIGTDKCNSYQTC